MSAQPREEFRRARRRDVQGQVAVIDTMTEQAIGRLGNISETGMLLMATVPLIEDGLYQVQFTLTDRNGPPVAIEVGVHMLWQSQPHAAGPTWSGFRFITMLDSQLEELRRWVDAEDGKR